MNKTELRFFGILKANCGRRALIVPQATRFFRFDNGDSYTPDFVVIDKDGVHVYEVKGGYRGAGWEQGYDRYYRAKEKFESEENRIDFTLVEWNRKKMEWRYE